MSDIQLIELIDRYLSGEMSEEEQIRFELLRQQNAEVNKRVAEQELFDDVLKHYAQRVELESRLNAIHSEIDVQALEEELVRHPSRIVQLWRDHHSKISVAASIAIFAILSTLFVTGYFNRNQSSFEDLKRVEREVENVKHDNKILAGKTNTLIHIVQGNPKATVQSTVKFNGSIGTGFAISSNGYIVTSYHLISGADSLYVQNADGDSFHAKLVYTEPQYDIAVLKITDTAFRSLGALPYSFKRSKTDLGEDVYTIGYPDNDVVFGPGYLTSASGYKGDTSQYMVSIPVNPGNSGGPLLDNRGNIIGIIKGRQTRAEGASFAIKSAYLIKSIQNIPADSVKRKLNLNSKNTLAGLSRTQQLKKLQNYVFMVKVYNN
jgi:S1-C subfamily serine protease